MGIPALVDIGGLLQLPPGEHPATLVEIESRYGSSSERRQKLMSGLRTVCEQMKRAKVQKIWIDGSFVTDKTDPNDIDGCWSAIGVTEESAQNLDPIFLKRDARELVKEKYGLDFFVAEQTESWSGLKFPKFFQIDRNGNPKGILVVTL